MFEQLRDQLTKNFNNLSNGTTPLFYVEIDRDEINEVYLSGFDEEMAKQEHTCNCCRSFLRQYGGIVGIVDNKLVSIFDGIELPDYKEATKTLSRYVKSLPVKDLFYSETVKIGTQKSLDTKRNIIWNHFYLELPKRFVEANRIDTIRAEKRDNKSVLKRSLDELTIDATETILELVNQNSLYRGKESEGILIEFLKLQKQYKNIPNDLRDNFAWLKSTQISPALSRIRNSAIGTFLIDLSEGVDLETSVKKFESAVAPANYKRPNSLVTPKMVEEAKAKLVEMGLVNSLERRFANEADLNVNDILFTDVKFNVDDIFAEVAKDGLVNPRTFAKVEELPIEKFIKDVLPTVKSIEALVENSHQSNFVTLLTSKDKDAPSLFKWNNNFSWSYSGNVTDSIKERVKAAGGKVDGVLRFSIQWNEDGKSICDLDAWATEPNRTKIGFNTSGRKPGMTSMTGQLDLDMIRPSGVGVENITWQDIRRMQEGEYKFTIHNYDCGRNDGFTAQVEANGEIFDYSYGKHFTGRMDVAKVRYSKSKGFTAESLLDVKNSVNSKEKWNINTNRFVKVNKVMLSPNHWENKTGNKHFLFFLDECRADETPRPFFNEFLKQEFDANRKVFEILGSKVKVEDTPNQLSGLGFSETQRNSLILRVTGKFTRVIKVLF